MPTLSLDGRELVVSLSPLERVGAVHGDLRLPLDAVTAADEVTEPLPAVRGIRCPGTVISGRLKLGTWRARGHRTFAAVRRGQPALRLRLDRRRGAPVDELLLSLPGAAGLAERVAAAVPAAGSRAVELPIPAAGTRLAGTLLLPDGPGPHAAALLLPGSGPVDRDSDQRRLPLGVTRLLAEELARAGVASLRYDKRGVGASGGDFRATGLHDLVGDARTALDALRARHEIDPDRLLVVGHSEGAIIATELAAAGGIAGAVLLSAPARTGADTLQYQARSLVATLPAPVRLLLRLLRTDLVRLNAKRIRQLRATTGDVARVGGIKVNARWFRESLDHDPAATMPRIAVPVLAVTGAADRQVDPADLETVRALVAGPVETHRVAGVDHILRRSTTGDPRAYRRESRRPLAAEVTEPVVGWIRRLVRRE